MKFCKPKKPKIYTLFLLAAFALFVPCCTRRETSKIEPAVAPPPFENAININTASVTELEGLPHIGRKLAEQIVEFRAAHGRFRRPEHLMLIHGISDKRFRDIRTFIRTE